MKARFEIGKVEIFAPVPAGWHIVREGCTVAGDRAFESDNPCRWNEVDDMWFEIENPEDVGMFYCVIRRD